MKTRASDTTFMSRIFNAKMQLQTMLEATGTCLPFIHVSVSDYHLLHQCIRRDDHHVSERFFRDDVLKMHFANASYARNSSNPLCFKGI